MGWDWSMSMMPYSPRWRRHRTKFQNYFHVNLSSVYQPGQTKETHTLLHNLLATPNDYNQHIRRSDTWRLFENWLTSHTQGHCCSHSEYYLRLYCSRKRRPICLSRQCRYANIVQGRHLWDLFGRLYTYSEICSIMDAWCLIQTPSS
jgi:hypothetical protein